MHGCSCSRCSIISTKHEFAFVRVRHFRDKSVFVFVRVQYFTKKLCSCSFMFDIFEKKACSRSFVFGIFARIKRSCSVRVHVRVRFYEVIKLAISD